MRILVDLPEEHVAALDRESVAGRISRAAIIRGLVDRHVRQGDQARRRAAMEAVFGAWKDRGIDGLDYQERMRAEWERDPIP